MDGIDIHNLTLTNSALISLFNCSTILNNSEFSNITLNQTTVETRRLLDSDTDSGTTDDTTDDSTDDSTDTSSNSTDTADLDSVITTLDATSIDTLAGSMLIAKNTSINISSSSFIGIECKDESCYGGAIVFIQSEFVLLNSMFENNSVEESGGAIAILEPIDTISTINNSIFKFNYALKNGGSIYI